MLKSTINKIVKDSIDLHNHVGPDRLGRKYSVAELIENQIGKISGVVVKRHTFSPMIDIINCRERLDTLVKRRNCDFSLGGSITLNYDVGGFNEHAVYGIVNTMQVSLSKKSSPNVLERIIVFGPTLHSASARKLSDTEYEIPKEYGGETPGLRVRKKNEVGKYISVLSRNGTLRSKVIKTLEMIKKVGAVFATGHLCGEEIRPLVGAALSMKITTIITHPFCAWTPSDQDTLKVLSKKGAYVEVCYISYKDGKDRQGNPYSLDKIIERIRDIGVKHCVISTDGGQIHNDWPDELLKEFVELLMGKGMKEEEIRTMVVVNPRAILKGKW